jgi:hypothetical protein
MLLYCQPSAIDRRSFNAKLYISRSDGLEEQR